MRRLAWQVKLVEVADERPGPLVPLRPEPLHRYSDRAQGILDGTLWAWGERRPLAIMKVELWPDRDHGRGRWTIGVSSSSSRRIAVEFFDGHTWASRSPGIEPRPVPDAPAPADAPAQRLSQSKALSRRLSAQRQRPNITGKTELRLLPKEIDRYADPEAGLLDGMIFAFVSATLPELLVFIEAWARGSRPPAWQYGFARQGTAAVTVLDRGKEAWTAPFVPSPTNTETYMNRSLPKGVEAQ